MAHRDIPDELRYTLNSLRINGYKWLPKQNKKTEDAIFALMRHAHRLGVREERVKFAAAITKAKAEMGLAPHR